MLLRPYPGTFSMQASISQRPRSDGCAASESLPETSRRLILDSNRILLEELDGGLERLVSLIVRAARGERWLRQERDALQRVVDGKMELLRTVYEKVEATEVVGPRAD